MTVKNLGIIGGGQLGSLLASAIIANYDSGVKKKLNNWRSTQTKSVKKRPK